MMSVNSKLRMSTAMNLGIPDRVPVMCQFSIGHMLLQLKVSPAEFWFDPEVFAHGLLALRALYGFDGILISLHGHNPHWRNDVQSRRLTNQGEEVLWKNGDKTICRSDDLPQQINAIERAQPDIEAMHSSNLPPTLDYIPVSQGLHFRIDPDHRFDIFKTVTAEVAGKFSLHGEITSPFDYFLDHFGYQEGLVALIETPEKSKQVLAHFTSLLKILALEMCETGIDAIKLSSPFAGAGFISPKSYAEFVLPFEREIIRVVRRKNVHMYLHTCGAIADRISLMLASGASGLECLDPPPLGDVGLEDAARIMRGKAFIKGNIDSVNLLLLGTDEEISADAKRKIGIGKVMGGFILSTACSIAPRAPKEKILLLREAIERWG